jgi:hypothetical protein
MNLQSVPTDDWGTLQLFAQLPNEIDDFVGAEVAWVDLEWCSGGRSQTG